MTAPASQHPTLVEIAQAASTASATVTSTATVGLLLAAAERRRFVATNPKASTKAVGLSINPAATFATCEVVIGPGESWVETLVPQVNWYAVTESGTISVAVQVADITEPWPATAWNPSDAYSGGFVLSNGNRTSTSTTTAVADWPSMRATKGYSAGKKYFEVRVDTKGGEYTPGVGIASAAAALDNYIGAGAGGYSVSGSGLPYGAGNSGTMAALADGDVIGVAVDFTAGSITLLQNGVAKITFTGQALAGTMFYPATYAYARQAAGVATIRTSDTQCTYPAPAGFDYWDAV